MSLASLPLDVLYLAAAYVRHHDLFAFVRTCRNTASAAQHTAFWTTRARIRRTCDDKLVWKGCQTPGISGAYAYTTAVLDAGFYTYTGS